MSDELKRAMEGLEAAIPPISSTRVGRRITTIETEHARTILAALRERDAAVEQARADEREAMYDMVQREDSRSLTGVSAHDPLRRLMDAIRARH